MKKKMNPRISASQAKNIIMMGRSGRMLGLDGDESASVVLGDADTKSVPKGRIGAGGILKVKLQLGNLIVNGSPESDPYIDLFSRDLSCRADSSGRCGIKVPTNLDYFRWVHFFEPNPGRLRQIQAQASDESVIRGTSIAVCRRTPFAESQGERVSLSNFLNPNANQTKNVIMPCDAEIDGVTFLRVYHDTYETDQTLTLMLSFAAVSERRAAVEEA